MVGYAESLITTILRGSEDVFSEGGQMMYDPLTAERIHPHACSYIPHLANPSPGKNSNPAKTSTESLRCASGKLSLKVHCRFQILLFTVIFKKKSVHV